MKTAAQPCCVELSQVACSACGEPLPVLDVEERQTRHASCGMPLPKRKTTRRKRP